MRVESGEKEAEGMERERYVHVERGVQKSVE